jgi:hypothetical protein
MTRWVVSLLSLFLFLLLLCGPAISWAETVDDTVANLVFSTEPQSVEPGVISGILTIQTVDAGGNPSNIGETGDLTFTSTSPTGEFVNESGSPVTTTMSRNSARRNFYYRDSTAGSYTLTVTLTGRTSQRTWTATQNIGVGQVAEADEDNDANNNAVVSASGGSNLPEAAKDKKTTISVPLRVEIVKVPPVVTDMPVTFRAKVTGVKKDDKGGVLVRWSFGDGSEALGLTVYHTYQFAGKYIVVLVASTAEEEVMTRLVVEVVEPAVEIGEVGYDPVPHVQLVNKTGKEIDLGVWRLSSNGRNLLLPANTIIAPNAKLMLPVSPDKLTLVADAPLALVAPTGRLVATRGSMAASATNVVPVERQTEIVAIKGNIKQLVERVDTIARQEWAAKQMSKAVVVAPEPVMAPVAAIGATPEAVVIPATPAVLELPKKGNVLERGWQRVKSVFSIKN